MDRQHEDPKLTDDAVARLPLASGRAELLEEIMRTPVEDRTSAPVPLRRRAAWAAPVAAAAAVAVVAAGPLWWPSAHDAPPATPTTQPQSQSPTADPEAYRAVLDQRGWDLTAVHEDGGGGGVTYERGPASIELTWRPGSTYEDYVEDRRHIVDPPADGDPVEVGGLTSQLWSYSERDHTVIRPVEAGHLLEVRGSGISREAFEGLLATVRLVDHAALEVALPAAFVTDAERPEAIEEILTGIAAASGQERQPGDETPPITSRQADPYHLGAEVAGQVACAWFRELLAARAAGDEDRVQEAVEVLGSTREWPVLLEMDAAGDYPDVVWEYADQVARGQVPEGFEDGLGC